MGGFIGGAQFGYNYQLRKSIVIGLEADIQGLTGHHISPANVIPFGGSDNTGHPFNGSTFVSATKNLDDFGTVRAQFGYLVTPTLLAFGTAGIAYGQVGSSTNVFQTLSSNANAGSVSTSPSSYICCNVTPTVGASGYSETRIGWTVGGGLEWMMTPNWSVKAEYLYYDLGKPNTQFGITSYSTNPAGYYDNVLSTTSATRFNGHVIRTGLNYHFNWGSAAVASKPADENDTTPESASYNRPYFTKLEGFGGIATEGNPDHKWTGQGGVVGSVLVPFSEHYAVQLDGQLGGQGNGVTPGLAAHAYWADTKKGLAGLYGQADYASWSGGQGDLKFGGEAAYFMERFTAQGILGVESQSFEGAKPAYNCQAYANLGCEVGYEAHTGIGLYDAYGNRQSNMGRYLFQVPAFFDHVELGYYPTDDLKITIAHEYTAGVNVGVLGAEYLFRTGNGIAPAVFIEGSLGGDGNGSIITGVRFYFGEEGDKSLIRRHREDDPATHLRRTLKTLADAQSKPSHNTKTPLPLLPTPFTGLSPSSGTNCGYPCFYY